MNLEKLTLSLYDILGYLFPGFVILFGLSVVEANFLGTNLLSFSSINKNLILSFICAYILGEISHSLISIVKDWRYSLFNSRKNRLRPSIMKLIREKEKACYGILLSENEEDLTPLETYTLADNYLLSHGGSEERELLMAREGFFKGSFFSFVFTLIVFTTTAFSGITKIQTSPGNFLQLNLPTTIALVIVSGLIAFLCRNRYLFYNRLKVNHIYLAFLSNCDQNPK